MPFLKECISSIEAQSYADWELIVVDNYSNDGSYEFLSDYALKNKKVKVFRNSGEPEIHVSMKLALTNAEGEFVTRMDADDMMPENKLESLINGLSEGKSIAVGKVKYFSEEVLGNGFVKYANWLNDNLTQEDPFLAIFKECVIPSPAWMMRKEDILFDHLFEGLAVPDDYLFAFNLYRHGYKIDPLNEVVHFWRDYASRNSRMDDRYSQSGMMDLKISKYLELRDPNSKVAIWGAGRKGKVIAKEFVKQGVSFAWLTENIEKIGKDIYGVRLEHPKDALLECDEVLVAVSNPIEQELVLEQIKKAQTKPVPFC